VGVAWNKILWGVDSGLHRGRVSSLKLALEAHHAYDSRPAAIRVDLGVIFVSLDLSKSNRDLLRLWSRQARAAGNGFAVLHFVAALRMQAAFAASLSAPNNALCRSITGSAALQRLAMKRRD